MRRMIRKRTSLWMELTDSLLHRAVILSDQGESLIFFFLCIADHA